jgi:hypothetical protein
MALPATGSDLQSSVVGIFTHPLSIFNGLASIFSKPALAAPAVDPFGVSQYGYVKDDPNLTAANQDSETYWAQNCSTDGSSLDWTKPVNSAWENSTVTNQNTGMPENTTTNPCLLIQAAAGSDGAIFDSSLLTAQDSGN